MPSSSKQHKQAVTLSSVDPVKALVFTAVLNGIAAVPLLFLILKIGSNEKIMGQFKSRWLSNSLLWITFVVMGAAALSLFFTLKS